MKYILSLCNDYDIERSFIHVMILIQIKRACSIWCDNFLAYHPKLPLNTNIIATVMIVFTVIIITDSLTSLKYDDLISLGNPSYNLKLPDDEWDAISLCYTSGTTGNPKGVVSHHRLPSCRFILVQRVAI